MIEYSPSPGQFSETAGWQIIARPSGVDNASPAIEPAEPPIEVAKPIQVTQPEAKLVSLKELADKIAQAPLKKFERDRTLTGHAHVDMVPLGKNGESNKYFGKPPRNQPVVIGVDHMTGHVAAAWSKGQNPIEGYHEGPANHINRRIIAQRAAAGTELKRDRFVALHGAVTIDPHHSTASGEKAKHILKIFAMHPDDLVKEGGEREKLRDIERKEREWEKGEVVPQNYVGELLAQRLMHAFDVESLEVVYAQPAHRIYESKMRKPIPRWAREGD